MVENVNETERAPAEAGIERFIGLEHLEPGSLHIRTWGDVADGTTFTRRCRPGQVLFGKRRAYQRKVAVAEFDAVVSGDIYVLAPKNDRLLPGLLPFLCLSERFFQHAVGTSAGSLSPRTNWGSLASFEFDLPPLDLQRRIADMLWAVDEAAASCEETGRHLGALRTSVSEAALRGEGKPCGSNGANWSSWPLTRVEDVCERISVGIVITPSKYYRPTGVRCFRSANVRRGFVEDNDWIFISDEAHRMHTKSILRAGDVLVVRSGVYAGMSCVVPPEYDDVNCIDVVFATPRGDALESEWLSDFINSSVGQIEIKRGERGLAQKHFGVDALRRLPLPLPPLSEQKRYLARLKEVSHAATRNQAHLHSLRSTSAALVASLFP